MRQTWWVAATVTVGLAVLHIVGQILADDALPKPDAVQRPDSPLMLQLPGIGSDTAKLNLNGLPRVKAQHAVISQGDPQWKFRLHNYLAHHDGKYWAMWSHGPVIEDKATQHVRYATSEDGVHWSEDRVLAGIPQEGYGWIARGFWQRDGQLLALASLYEAPTAFAGDLNLQAFAWDAEAKAWQPQGVIFDNAINNFAPKKLPSGEWMMSRRDRDRDVFMLIGGVKSITDWRSFPVADYEQQSGERPEEPFWWVLPDKNLVALFRDNGGSHRLYRAFSTDGGKTWSQRVRTNFPDARSKFFTLQTSRGDFVMVSNPNPKARNPLCLSVSRDGLIFTSMYRLPIPGDGSFQYPHVIEHQGQLLIAFSRNKTEIEVLKVNLDDVQP